MATRLRELGASVASSLANVEARFDVVFESVGGETFKEAVGKLNRRGLVLWFGQASGRPATLDFFELCAGRESMTLRHFVYSDLPDNDDRADLGELIRRISAGELRPSVALQVDWRMTSDALKRMGLGQLGGKAVFTIS